MATAAPVIVAEMRAWVALGGANFGIVGNDAHSYGFHRAASEVPATDYSRRRDPAGPNAPAHWDWACAGDFAHQGDARLRGLHADLLRRLVARDPGLSMICEFIGQPVAGGPVVYWSDWDPVVRRYTGSGHDRWSHISWYRSRADQSPVGMWGDGSTPAPAPPVDDGVLRQGASGDRVRDLQGRLNAAILANLETDGEFGPNTEAAVRTFQTRAGITADGEVGPQTMAALGRWTAPLAVDGDLGRLTVAALQRADCRHGQWCAVDGDLGPATKAATQRVLGVRADGVWGPVTVRTLQAKVGAKLDGQLGPDTISHLQVALNLGAF